MGDLVRRTLKKPHLRVVQHRESLDFIFTREGSFPSALRKENPSLYRCLFKSRKKGDWTDLLVKGYGSRVASGKGQKSVRLSLRLWLNRLFLNALDSLVSNAVSKGTPYKGDIKQEVEAFKAFLTRKPGPHRAPRRQEQDAIRFAKRYEELKPQARKLKAFVKQQNNQDEKALARAAEKALPSKWLSYITQDDALQHLPTINNNPETRSSTLNGKWMAWQLSVAVIYCEEKVSSGRITRGPDTIYKYIGRGKVLLKKTNLANKRASSASFV